MYVLNAIISGHIITKELILGGMSCVFWTLIILTSVKYVWLALNADNNGEGGIFALYALVRKKKVLWTIIPAMIGCAMLIADGFITPPISISSAVEGLLVINPNIPTVPIVIIILIALFVFQQFGTQVVGKIFGPVMLLWFFMIGTLGLIQIIQYPLILEALNPYYALNLLVNYPGGFWFLGAVFLCTTGGEALYSDLGHCGKENIRMSWYFVIICLVLNYAGQNANILANYEGKVFEGASPFYAIMPDWFLPIGIAVSTFAAIIASQALITGVFTLVNEAMKLKLWPNIRVMYPSIRQGQIYVPFMNWFLLVGCIIVVLIFRESSNMEAAYGLAITIDMLMTTLLLTFLMRVQQRAWWLIIGIPLIFLPLEGSFFISNLMKFHHGGWFTILIASALFLAMWILHEARQLRAKHTDFVKSENYLSMLQDLIKDESLPLEANNLVYMAMSNNKDTIDSNIIYSIFRKRPRRANVYWFVHVDITNKPYGASYTVDTLIPKQCFYIKLKFGFKVEHKVNLMFSKIVEDMIESGEVDGLTQYPSMRKYGIAADFKFILINSRVASDDALSAYEQFIVKGYRLIKKVALNTAGDLGLDVTNMEEEKVPIKVAPSSVIEIDRDR